MKSAIPALLPGSPGRFGATLRCQRGQALIYGLFVLTGGLAALFFLFNTGQLTAEKTKLVNTADAVAYSAGVVHARALNFQAYTNRAIVANTVTIAQSVSLSSWFQYVVSTAAQGVAVGNPAKYPLFYPSYALMQSHAEADGLIARLGGGVMVAPADALVRGLAGANALVYGSLLPAQLLVMQEVANFNYMNDGAVTILPIVSTANAYRNFVSPYSGNERTRLAEVVEKSAKLDSFVRSRSWHLPGIPGCPAALAAGRFDRIDRRGGTELIGFDEWKALDTIAEKSWRRKNRFDLFCRRLKEAPSGWAGETAGDTQTIDLEPFRYDSSPRVNPATSARAAIDPHSATGYTGLPAFYDLSASARGESDPKLKFAVRLSRAVAQTRTSEGRSAIAATPILNAYRAKPAIGSELEAVSASEAFFERPDAKDAYCSDGTAMRRANCYGKDKLSKPTELGSLFNPYWQTRLIDPSQYVIEAVAESGVAP